MLINRYFSQVRCQGHYLDYFMSVSGAIANCLAHAPFRCLKVMLHGTIRNRPFPSSPEPLYQNEVRCSTFLVEMSFICMRMKNHFHIKG